jgi:hypothetical protein
MLKPNTRITVEKDVVIDREKERNGPKSWPILLGRDGLSMRAPRRRRRTRAATAILIGLIHPARLVSCA